MSNTTFFCPSSPQFLPLTSGFLLGWFESYDPGHGCDELMAQCSKMTFLFTKKEKDGIPDPGSDPAVEEPA